MPTIEFFGWRSDERDQLEGHIRERLKCEPFREDCVFVSAAPSRVLDWQGRDRPFVRVSTRSAERAQRFLELLRDSCDVEIMMIDFQPSSKETAEPNGG
jgi:hypothetical protein